MSSEKLSARDRGALLEGARSMVRAVVDARRSRKQKTLFAFADAAADLGITPARAKSLYYLDKVWSVAVSEYAALQSRFLAHLDAEAEALEKQAEALRERRRQLSLLGDLECGNSSACGGGNASCGGLSGEDSLARAEARYRELRAEIARDRRVRK